MHAFFCKSDGECPRVFRQLSLEQRHINWSTMAFFSAALTERNAVVPSPVVCSLPNLSAPSIAPSCEEEWRRLEAANNHAVIYGLDWHEQHLVAVTSSGHVCIWNVPAASDNEDDDMDQEQVMKEFADKSRPLVRIQVSTGTLYSVKFVEQSPRQTLLMMSGNEGVLGYDWQQWKELLSEGGGHNTPPEPKFHCKPHRSLSTVEINDFSVSDSNHVFGAAGDAMGYKWDLETSKILSTYPSARRGYLHSIQCMPSDNTVVIGGEDGLLAIWDGHHDKPIDSINIQAVLESNASLVEKDACIGNTTLNSLWISNISSPSQHWWTICGGMNPFSAGGGTRPSPRNSPATVSSAAGGFVTSFHAPTRSLLAGHMTRETPQYSCSTASTLVTVANEGVVSHWTPLQLERRERVWCSPPSCFAAAIGNGENLAVGGVGNQVDIFDNVVGNKSFSLTL